MTVFTDLETRYFDLNTHFYIHSDITFLLTFENAEKKYNSQKLV